jgi:hypothetical protein
MAYGNNTPASDTPGDTSISATNIYNSTVDNNNYCYYIWLRVPPSTNYNFFFHSASIEYEFPA